MRRILCFLCALMIAAVTAGCGTERADELTSLLRAKYLSSAEITALLEVKADHDEYITCYTFACEYSAEGCVITVAEPESLAGLVTRVKSGGAEHEYAGTVLIPPPVTGSELAVPQLLYSLLSSVMTAIPSYSDLSDGVLYAEYRDSALLHRVSFDSGTLLPLRSETFSGERLVLTADYSDCILKGNKVRQ